MLLLVPIGYLSGDAVYLGDVALSARWALNPNHILLEPAARAWVRVWQVLRPDELAADALTRLSVLLGAISALLFRVTIAPQLTSDRRVANIGAAAFLLASAFDRLWVSGEVHMIQMPFLVGMLAYLMRYSTTSRTSDLARSGACGALAVLAFAANVVVIAFVAVALVFNESGWRRNALRTLAFPVSAGLIAGAGALLAWVAAGLPGQSVLGWLTSYRGSANAAQHLSYGLRLTGGGIIEAAARSTFGLISALVDLSPLTGFLRQGFPFSLAVIVHPLAALLAVGVAISGVWRLRASPSPARLVSYTAFGVSAALWLFGMIWDNSDDQFFFQLTPWWAAAVVGFASGRRPLALAPLAFVLLVNARDLIQNYILPDRAAQVATLREALHGGLVVAAGGDPAAAMLRAYRLGSGTSQVFKIRSIADSLSAAEGLGLIRDTIQAALERGETVTTVNVLGMDARRFPWPGLARRGYSLPAVEQGFSGAEPPVVTVRTDWVVIAEVRPLRPPTATAP